MAHQVLYSKGFKNSATILSRQIAFFPLFVISQLRVSKTFKLLLHERAYVRDGA